MFKWCKFSSRFRTIGNTYSNIEIDNNLMMALIKNKNKFGPTWEPPVEASNNRTMIHL